MAIAAEADVVPHFRPHAEVRTHPEVLEIEVFADLGIVEFVALLFGESHGGSPGGW